MVISWLFVTRWNDILPALRTIIRLPESEHTHQLDTIKFNFLQQKANCNLFENVVLYCELLKHESKLIRYLAVETILRLCIKERKKLFLLELNPSGTSSSSSLGLIIFENLLLLSGRENDLNVRQILGKCLGEIGAIDPAKVPFTVNSTKISNFGMELNAGSQYQKYQDPPWLLSPFQFCLVLIDKFLVPRLRLRDNDAAQDRICYAIQVLVFSHLLSLICSRNYFVSWLLRQIQVINFDISRIMMLLCHLDYTRS